MIRRNEEKKTYLVNEGFVKAKESKDQPKTEEGETCQWRGGERRGENTHKVIEHRA